MSRLARFDSSKPYRPSPRITFIAGIFALGLVAGGLVGISIWERNHQPVANDPFAPGGVFERAREAARNAQTSGPMPPLGRYSVDVLRVIEQSGINVDYMYAFSERRNDKAMLVFRFENADAAVAALMGCDLKLVSGFELFAR